MLRSVCAQGMHFPFQGTKLLMIAALWELIAKHSEM